MKNLLLLVTEQMKQSLVKTQPLKYFNILLLQRTLKNDECKTDWH